MKSLSIAVLAALFSIGASQPVERLSLGFYPQYFSQNVDHFGSDYRRFPQRYWVDNTFYREGGPVFLHLEGEGEAGNAYDMAYDNQTWNKVAQELGAVYIVLEHRFVQALRKLFSDPIRTAHFKRLRYYGESRLPNQNDYFPLLLTTDQALEDIATFVTAMKQKMSYLKDAAWITLGCSYAGTLSAWARQRYPQLIQGAVSTSAPVLAKADFHEYEERKRKALDAIQPGCSEALVELWRSSPTQSTINRIQKAGEVVQFGPRTELQKFCSGLGISNGESVEEQSISDSTSSDEENSLWLFQMFTEFGFFSTSLDFNHTAKVRALSS